MKGFGKGKVLFKSKGFDKANAKHTALMAKVDAPKGKDIKR